MSDALVWIIVLVAIGGVTWWSVYQGRPGVIAFDANAAPREIVQGAIQTFSTRGWLTTTQSGTSVTFTKQAAANCLVTLLLFAFGIIPGLIYLLLAKRTLTLSVVARASGGSRGTSQVQLAWSRNGGGRGPALAYKQMIAPTAALAVSSPQTPGILAETVEDVTGGALSEAELRREQRAHPPQTSLPPGDDQRP